MRISVLGGAGKMGCISTKSLVEDPRVDEVVILDINMDQARLVANYLDSPKLSIRSIDVNDKDSLVQALAGSDCCLNATVYYTNLAIMDACVKAGTNYTDMGGLFHLTLKQLELSDIFSEAGLSAVLCMGSAPGIPNIQARYAADQLDTIESIKIYDGIKPPPPDDLRFTYAVSTILEELTLPPMIFNDGEYVACEPLSGFEEFWFMPPLGLLPMHLSLHSEPATLPITFKDKGVRECFFKINYWGMSKQTIEKVRVLSEYGFNGTEPVKVDGQCVSPRALMLTLMSEFVPPITDFLAAPTKHPPDWVKEIVTVVQGTKDGKEVTYRVGTLTCKGALPTGFAPAISAIWLAEKRIPLGVHPPEAVIDPLPFFKEMEAKEIITQVGVTSNIS